MSARCLLLIATLLALPARAEEAPAPNLAGTPGAAAPGPVATLSAALRLYARAEAAGDAFDMAVAARLAARIDLRQATGWTRTAGPTDAGSHAPAAPGATLDTLLSGAAMAGALLMAEEDEALADILLDLPPPDPRVRSGGASGADGRLAPTTEDTWEIPFAGQSPAEVAVFPTAPGALLWRVEDATGNPVCPVAQAAALTACRFVPARNGFFRVVVTNGGSDEAGYLLLSN